LRRTQSEPTQIKLLSQDSAIRTFGRGHDQFRMCRV